MATKVTYCGPFYDETIVVSSIAELVISSFARRPDDWVEDGEMMIHTSGLKIRLTPIFCHVESPVHFNIEQDESAAVWTAFQKWQPAKINAMLSRHENEGAA